MVAFSAIIFVFVITDLRIVISSLSDLKLHSIAASIAFFSLSIFIASLRYFLLNRFFYTKFSWKQSLHINLKSLAYSQFIFPIFSQIFGRILHSRRLMEKPEYQVVITIFEKAIAAFVLILIVFALVFYNPEINQIKLENFTYSFLIILGVLLTFAVVSTALLTRKEWDHLKQAISFLFDAKILYAIPITACVHMSTLIGFYHLARSFFPELDVYDIFSASALIILVLSVPISFSSWGVREVSATAIFASHGIDASVSVAFGLTVGFVNLAVVIFWFVFSSFFVSKNEVISLKINPKLKSSMPAFLTLLICILGVGFPVQFRVPLEGGLLTLNLADPIAFVVGLSFFAWWFIHHREKSIWLVSSLKFGLCLFPLFLLVSYVVGYISFGSNNWAMVNRLLGQIVPFSYLFTGAMLGMFIGYKSTYQFFSILAVSLLSYALIQVCLQPVIGEDLRELFKWSNLNGYYQDRNAYSLFLLLVLSALFPIVSVSKSWLSSSYFLIALIILVIFIAGSRSAFIATFIVLIFLYFIRKELFIKLVPMLISSFLLYSACLQILNHTTTINFGNEAIYSRFLKSDIFLITDQRALSWFPAWEIWLENPYFGAGLGYYYEKYLMVVHNVPLWLLSETGLFGFLIFSIIPFSMLAVIFTKNSSTFSSMKKQSLIYGFVIIAVFSMTQDIFFQRSVWFFIGFFMVSQKTYKYQD